LNSSQTNGNTIQCNIQQNSNAIVQDLSEWNIYLQSVTITTAELPYFNCFRNIIDPVANPDIMNFSITFYDTDDANQPFDLGGPAPAGVIGFGTNVGNAWQGVTVFLTYVSENLPNSTGRSYYNIHSINQFMSFINTAINYIISIWTGAPIAEDSMYFSYDPTTQFYQLTMPNAFYDPDSTVEMYTNSFLERILDGFRWIYLGVPYSIGDANYTGMDYQFVRQNYPFNQNGAMGPWTFTTEYSCVANMLDVHSILIQANNGDLQNVRQQVVPLAESISAVTTNKSLNLPSLSVLKNLDIDFTNLALSSINNCFIQYESAINAFPINTFGNGPLKTISLQLYIQTIDNSTYPLNIPAGSGYANVKICIKRKLKNKT